MADINNHFVSDCTIEVRTEGSRGKCTCFIQYYTDSLNVARGSVCVYMCLCVNESVCVFDCVSECVHKGEACW